MAESLKVHVAASQAFQRLSAAIKAHSRGAEPLQETAGTVCNLLEATATNAGKRGVTAALLHTPGAFHSILSLIKVAILCSDLHLSSDAALLLHVKLLVTLCPSNSPASSCR